jgi:hypothetical protein
MQSPCRIDGRPPDWILSTKFSLNSFENDWIATLLFPNLFLPKARCLCPRQKYIFVTQSTCRIDGRPPDWLLSPTTSYKLLWKWTCSNPSFSATPINRSSMFLQMFQIASLRVYELRVTSLRVCEFTSYPVVMTSRLPGKHVSRLIQLVESSNWFHSNQRRKLHQV